MRQILDLSGGKNLRQIPAHGVCVCVHVNKQLCGFVPDATRDVCCYSDLGDFPFWEPPSSHLSSLLLRQYLPTAAECKGFPTRCPSRAAAGPAFSQANGFLYMLERISSVEIVSKLPASFLVRLCRGLFREGVCPV